jgi:hypothetical protein
LSLIARLKAGADNTKAVKFPGKEDVVVLRVLTNAEVQAAEFATEHLFKEAGIKYDTQTVEAYEKEKTLQLLWRALRDPEDTAKPAARDVDELRKLLTQAEKDALVSEYLALQEECSPNLEDMPEEKFLELVEEVKKTPMEVSSISSISLLRRLVTSLASQPVTSQTDSGST